MGEGKTFVLTVTLQVYFFFPHFAVMVAFPTFFAFTVAFAELLFDTETVAIFLLDDFQVTSLFFDPISFNEELF